MPYPSEGRSRAAIKLGVWPGVWGALVAPLGRAGLRRRRAAKRSATQRRLLGSTIVKVDRGACERVNEIG